MMRLYHSPTSPFVRMVMVALHETELLDQVEITPAIGTAVQPGSLPLSQNPIGKIPTLERPDGPALYDSRVIIRYIDHLAGGVLYMDPPKLWDVLTLEATGHGMAEAALLIVYEARCRSPEKQSEEWVEAQWAKVERALDTLESRWISHLLGPFDASHVAIGCGLHYLDLRHAGRNWRSGRPELTKWEAKLSSRPSMVATLPPPA